ncbi:hypothetical protein D3C78_1830250 [compost metagenome]
MLPTIIPGTSRNSSLMSRAPLALISSPSITLMLPGTAAGDCLSRVAVSTCGSGRFSRNRSSASKVSLNSNARASEE